MYQNQRPFEIYASVLSSAGVFPIKDNIEWQSEYGGKRFLVIIYSLHMPERNGINKARIHFHWINQSRNGLASHLQIKVLDGRLLVLDEVVSLVSGDLLIFKTKTSVIDHSKLRENSRFLEWFSKLLKNITTEKVK